MRKTGERRKHAFLPFSERVSLVKINPIHRSRRGIAREALPEAESLFVGSMRKWAELNMSTNFTDLLEKTSNEAQSLPMVLHNQQFLCQELLEHIQKLPTEIYSGDALLDLLVCFARDLGEDFEPWYAKTLKTLVGVIEDASKGDERLHLVEQVFDCLAHLFKYLSRLITTDLVPTYSLIAPLFGRERKQRGFVMRFAAESLAFLIRRSKDASLTKIIIHIAGDSNDKEYVQAAAVLLADTLKGPGQTLHSRAHIILKEIFAWSSRSLSSRVLVEILHHVRQGEHAQKILDALCQSKLGLEGVLVAAGLRKGDRVTDWAQLFNYAASFSVEENATLTVASYGALFARADIVTAVRHFPSSLSKLTPRILEVVASINVSNFDVLLPLAKLDMSAESALLYIRTSTRAPESSWNADDLFEQWWHHCAWGGAELRHFIYRTPALLASDLAGRVGQPDFEQVRHLPPSLSLLDALEPGHPSLEWLSPCLTSVDQRVRRAALRLILNPYAESAQSLDSIEHTIEHSRNLSMRITRLTEDWPQSDNVAGYVLPRFLFGLSGSRFKPVADSAIQCLKIVAQRRPELFLELSLQWIFYKDDSSELLSTHEIDPPKFDDYNCPQLSRICDITREYWTDDPINSLKIEANTAVHVESRDDYRSLGLRALSQAPAIAERKIEVLTPLLLNEASFTDSLALLALFREFKQHSSELVDRYLWFLGSKHVPLQKLALDCILSATKHIKNVKGHLEALIDGSKDELATLDDWLHEDQRYYVFPLIVRILYGRSQIAQKGRIALSSLVSLGPEAIQLFGQLSVPVQVDSRKQLGFANLVADVATELGSFSAPLVTEVVPGLLRLDPEEASKSLRQTTAKALSLLISYVPKETLCYWAEIRKVLIGPQLPNFGAKNREQPSQIMHLVGSVSSADPKLIDRELVDAFADCLVIESKPAVINEVLKVLGPLPQAYNQVLAALPPLLKLGSAPVLDWLLKLDAPEESYELTHALLTALEHTRLGRTPLLQSLAKLLPGATDVQKDSAFDILSPLWRISDPRARLALGNCFVTIGGKVGPVLSDLTAFDKHRLGMPDFDKRLPAFQRILDVHWTRKEWRPLLNCLLFCMRDPEELAIRQHALYTLQQYVRKNIDNDDIVLPAVRLGLRDEDMFRPAWVELLGTFVEAGHMKSLEPLLMDGDEEANFFTNINHIQVHRRRRAVRRLAELAPQVADAAAHYLLPIIEPLVKLTGNKDGELNNLADDALQAVHALSEVLTENQFRAVVKRYVQLILKSQQALRKPVRLLSAVSFEKRQPWVIEDVVKPLHKLLLVRSNENQNLPERIPVAIPIAHAILALDSETVQRELPSRLTELCQMLRSRTPELREQARAALVRISKASGAEFLPFILMELRSALSAGSQRHVLSYTVSVLLKEVELGPSDLDPIASLVTNIIIEDVLGSTGEEKDSVGYHSQSKEVKQRPGPVMAEILARHISLESVRLIIEPIKKILIEKPLSSRDERKVNELLMRVATGLRSNVQSNSQNALIMLWHLHRSCQHQEQSKTDNKNDADAIKALNDQRREHERYFLVRIPEQKQTFPDQLHLIQAFVLTCIQRVGDLSSANIKGLAPMLVQGVQSSHEPVAEAALKLASPCLRYVVSETDELAAASSQRAMGILEQSVTGELSQAALRLLSTLLRHRPDLEVRLEAVALVLKLVQPELDEPQLQAGAYGYIRAVLSRNILIPEVYDVMDQISRTMVSNGSGVIRSSARAAFLQFLTTYPQGSHRLQKCYDQLGANFRYKYSSGRLSAIEMVRILLEKITDDRLDANLNSYFIEAVHVLVNDEEKECRDAAAELIRRLAQRDNVELTPLIRRWLSGGELLIRGALEVCNIIQTMPSELASDVRSAASSVLTKAAKSSDNLIDWQLVYFALRTVAKDPPLEYVEHALLFPHPWVRAQAARMVGQAFKEGWTGNLSGLTRKFLRMMGAPLLPSADGVQLVKNLVYVAQKEPSEVPQIISRLSGICRHHVTDAELSGSKKAAVQALAALSNAISDEVAADVAGEAIRALLIVTDGLEAENALPDLLTLASEALQIWDHRLGTPQYLRHYTEAKRFVEDLRQKRRAKRSVLAVTHPELSARKRLKKNASKKRRDHHAKA